MSANTYLSILFIILGIVFVLSALYATAYFAVVQYLRLLNDRLCVLSLASPENEQDCYSAMSDALPTEPDHVSANDKPHGDDNRKDGTLKMPPLYFLTKWPVTIPIMGAFVAIYFLPVSVFPYQSINKGLVSAGFVEWER